MLRNKQWFGGIIVSLVLLTGLCSSGWAATGGSHFTYGIDGLQAPTLPPPGLHYIMYNLWYDTGTYKDNGGHTLHIPGGNTDVTVFASVQRLIYTTNIKILGADYGMDLIVPLLYQNVNVGYGPAQSSSFTLGDIMFEPFDLGWHTPHWDVLFLVAIVFPTGSFRGDDPSSPGMGYWAGSTAVGATYYFDEQKTWSASAVLRWMINFDSQKDTNITPGDELILEYGIGKEFAAGNDWRIRPALIGADYWQITDDSGGNARYPVNYDQKQGHAAGAEVNVMYLPALFQVNLRLLQDYGVHNGPSGTRCFLTFVKSF